MNKRKPFERPIDRVLLTHKAVEGYQPLAKPYEVRDILPGLRLQVWPSGAKTWVWRYRFNGKPKKMTMPGRFPALGVSAAREAAIAAATKHGKGIDPSAEKIALRQCDPNATVEAA